MTDAIMSIDLTYLSLLILSTSRSAEFRLDTIPYEYDDAQLDTNLGLALTFICVVLGERVPGLWNS